MAALPIVMRNPIQNKHKAGRAGTTQGGQGTGTSLGRASRHQAGRASTRQGGQDTRFSNYYDEKRYVTGYTVTPLFGPLSKIISKEIYVFKKYFK